MTLGPLCFSFILDMRTYIHTSFYFRLPTNVEPVVNVNVNTQHGQNMYLPNPKYQYDMGLDELIRRSVSI